MQKVGVLLHDFNGSKLGEQMLKATYFELLKSSAFPKFYPKNVTPEKTVVLNENPVREGRFDFFVETLEGKLIGAEVLSRPSKGKLLQKLAYTKQVDEFIFVLPKNALELYRKKKKNGLHSSTRKKFLPQELGSKKIFVWLFDQENKNFSTKNELAGEYNIKKL